MRGWFEPRPQTDALSVEDRREALVAARAFHEGDGDGAAIILETTKDPVRLTAALMDLVGALVYELAVEADRPEDEVWSEYFAHLNQPQHEFVRKLYRRNQT